MDFIFTCPNTQEIFHSDHFEVFDNRGICVDQAGNKILDAKVRLTQPCPQCGGHHVYKASELSCPFTGIQENGKEGSDGRP